MIGRVWKGVPANWRLIAFIVLSITQHGGSNLWIEPPGKASLSTCVHGTEASGLGANSVLLLWRTGEISPACLRTKQRLAAVAQVFVSVSEFICDKVC